MATLKAVSSGSRFCRDCGGTVTRRGGLQWCEHTSPKPVCENLTRERRLYCEHCRHADPGLGRCPRCRQPPTIP